MSLMFSTSWVLSKLDDRRISFSTSITADSFEIFRRQQAILSGLPVQRSTQPQPWVATAVIRKKFHSSSLKGGSDGGQSISLAHPRGCLHVATSLEGDHDILACVALDT